MAFDEDKKATKIEVSIMYDKYYVRKKEIAENVLMIAICDVEQDCSTTSDELEVHVTSSSFNIGKLDLLFKDYEANFRDLEETIEDISKNISQTM